MVYETELKSTGSVTQNWVSLKIKIKKIRFFELSPNPRNLLEMRHMENHYVPASCSEHCCF